MARRVNIMLDDDSWRVIEKLPRGTERWPGPSSWSFPSFGSMRWATRWRGGFPMMPASHRLVDGRIDD